MHPITKELREYVGAVRAYHLTDIHGKKREYVDTTTRELLDIADRIEVEHRRRMDDCRREVRREVIRYMRGVLTDFDRGVRRVRKGDKAEVVRCRDCENVTDGASGGLICMLHGIPLLDGDGYCSRGERREVY